VAVTRTRLTVEDWRATQSDGATPCRGAPTGL